MVSEQLILFGTISKPHGIRGEFKLQSTLSGFENLDMLKDIYLKRTADSESVHFHVQGLRRNEQTVYLKLQEVCDMTEAEKLRSFLVYAPKSQIALPENADFVEDLIGAKAYIAENEQYIGICTDVLSYPMHDIYVFSTENGEMMIPARREIITAIDKTNKKIFISQKGLKESAVWQ